MRDTGCDGERAACHPVSRTERDGPARGRWVHSAGVTEVLPDDLDAARAEIEELREENRRLRGLVGPLEQDYEALQRQIDQAADAVREAEAANGELRGEIMDLTVALGQARHNMGSIHRIVYQRTRRLAGRILRPIRRRWNDRKGSS